VSDFQGLPVLVRAEVGLDKTCVDETKEEEGGKDL
jgi:hypothetical protein